MILWVISGPLDKVTWVGNISTQDYNILLIDFIYLKSLQNLHDNFHYNVLNIRDTLVISVKYFNYYLIFKKKKSH